MPEGAHAGRRGDLQPPQGQQPARDRRDDPLRGPELRRAADREPARTRTRPTTPARTRACRRRRSATPGWTRSRPRRTRPRATSSTTWSSPGTCGEHVLHLERGGVRARPGELPAGARGPGRLADRLLSVPRLAVLGHPVAHSRSPAMHTAALAELGLGDEWSYEAIEVAPERLRRAGALASRRGLRRGQRHRPAQARGAGRGRLRLGGGARDRRREHAQLRGRRRSPPRTPTRSGSPRAIGEPRRRQAGARPRRRRLGPRGGLGAAQRGRRRLDLEPNAGEGRRPWPRSSTSRVESESRATEPTSTCCSTPRPSAWSRQARARPTSADLKAFPFAADSLSERQVVVDLVYGPHETALAYRSTATGRSRDRRARGPGPPGSRLAADLDRAGAPAGDDARRGSRELKSSIRRLRSLACGGRDPAKMAGALVDRQRPVALYPSSPAALKASSRVSYSRPRAILPSRIEKTAP